MRFETRFYRLQVYISSVKRQETWRTFLLAVRPTTEELYRVWLTLSSV